jgi:hypothetical protein
MCKEISPEIKPKGPATGPKPDRKGDMLDESDLPWHKIRTRFDLAREHLKISLQRLSDEKYFSIVWFGTESGTLPSCPGLMRATKANVMRAINDLDEIVPGDPDPVRSPDGRLRGNTNMHSGLLQAFSLSGRGFVDQYAYVDPGPLTEGCDTIFLLSDGAPSCDGFTCNDVDYGEGEVVIDREYGEKAARTPRINYAGPYVDPNRLVDDVGRMNAFRRVRIHCIGIGEANLRLLDRLAHMGHGEVYVVGGGRRGGSGGSGGGRRRNK